MLKVFSLFFAVACSYYCTYEVTYTVDNFVRYIRIGDREFTGGALGPNRDNWPVSDTISAAGDYIVIQGRS
jgi:hypothetical protein